MPSKIRHRTGKILLQRLGTLKPVRQGYWKRAPATEGLWAFPWPYFSMFFAAHQYRDITPRRYVDRRPPEAPNLADEYLHWRREVAPRVLPIRKFWYCGELFTHVNRKGHDLGLGAWERVDAREFASRAARFLTRGSYWRDSGTWHRVNCFDVEALEVFIAIRGTNLNGFTRSLKGAPAPAP